MNQSPPRSHCFHDSLFYRFPILYDLLAPLALGWVWRRAARRVDPRPGERVLELGCGPGYLTRRLAGSGAWVVGVDLLSGMLRRAARKKGPYRHLALATLLRLPFRDASFDKVAVSLVLHEMPEPARGMALEEVHRVLKPGGKAIFAELLPSRLPWHWLFVRLFENPEWVIEVAGLSGEAEMRGLRVLSQETAGGGVVQLITAVK